LSGLKDFVPTAIPEDDPAEEECHIVCGEAHDGGGVNEIPGVSFSPVPPQVSQGKSASFNYLLDKDVSTHVSSQVQPPCVS